MPRRNRPERRRIDPDPRYNNATVQQTINRVMQRGKKSTAERIVYEALHRVGESTRQDALEVFLQALRNVTPQMEVKPRRVGGATYQVPVEIRADRRNALAIRWLLTAARARKGMAMARRLAAEIEDAYHNTGAAVKRREDTHRMAEANRAFVHYRW
ncbi:MAG: 30S ribosomal protein S7 [Chloroflexi bacterium]|nr:30S ribosomal protein S7 [Chloroflexota bacterium]